MTENISLIAKTRMIESIRTGIRKQVVCLYQSWASSFIDKEEFDSAMCDTRSTAECIVESMEIMGLLGSEETLHLINFIRALTETY